jgi:hypothetical protein
MLFNMRMVNMQHLWEPSREFKGAPTTKPNYFITVITPKTRAGWWEEPLLAPAWAAYSELMNKTGMNAQMITEWPIKDGDMPSEPGKTPTEWAKGQWILGGSSSSPIKAEIVQNNNVAVLPAKVGVKPGDYVSLGCSAAIKQTNARGLKHFCNTVLFTAAGEEIAVGNSVSGAELYRTAEAQGLRPVGFGAPGGGFGGGYPGGQPNGPGAGGPGNPGQGPFTQPGPHGNAGGFAPTQGGPAMPYNANPPNNGGPGVGGSAYPSNQPQGGPGFGGAGPGMPQSYGPGGTPANGGQFPSNNGPGAQPNAYPSNPGAFPGR